jgi:ATP-dependent DNA ligase
MKIAAMLYREADESEIDAMIASGSWALEPKYDGVRCLAQITPDDVKLLNRNGAPLSAASTNSSRPQLIKYFDPLRKTLGPIAPVFDGELLDDGTFMVFDIVTPDAPMLRRRETLENVADALGWEHQDTPVKLATQASGASKQILYDAIRESGGEGVMLKRYAAHYEPQRTRTAGFKVKFTHHVDCVVTNVGVDGKANAELSLWFDERPQVVGHCSTHMKGSVSIGDVVEVEYLYVGANGKLVQPRLSRVRHDKPRGACTSDQLLGKDVKKWVA